MNNFEICVNNHTAFYSSTETSIIPTEDGSKVLLVPPTGSFFDTTVSIRESKSDFIFGPFDPNATNITRSFTEMYDYLTDDENLFSENENFESDSEQKEYIVDKDYIYELLDSLDIAFPFEEFMTALTVLLEEFPTVVLSNNQARETTPDDIILILENLIKSNIRLEDALQEMINFSSDDFISLVLAKDKVSKYAYLVGLEIDSGTS